MPISCKVKDSRVPARVQEPSSGGTGTQPVLEKIISLIASHHWGSSLPSRAITGVVGGQCSLCSAPILSMGTGQGLGALVGVLAAVKSWNSGGTGQAQ